MPQIPFKTWDYKEQTKAKPRTTASCMRGKLRPERGGKPKLYNLAGRLGFEPR